MRDLAGAIATSWTIDPWLLAGLTLTWLIYLRGWSALRRSMPERYGLGRLAALTGGLATVWVALASPLDPLGGLLLQAHMVQHLLLMMVAPPLLLIAWPGPPLLRGLPWRMRSAWAGPLIASPTLKRVVDRLVHPVTAWVLFVVVTWAWHAPVLYEAAVLNPTWHKVEHASFLFVSVLFWWPVLHPWPTTRRWPRFMLVVYLLAADLQNTIFAAAFTFWTTPIYSLYAAGPRIGNISAIDDQSTAGAIMWVAGSAAFLLPVGWLLMRQLQPRLVLPARPAQQVDIPLKVIGAGASTPLRRHQRPGDWFRTPVVGRMLRSNTTRRTLQWLLLLLAAAVVIDGLWGPRHSAMNLAGVAPWTHWRGFVVLGLLLAGNLFCFACPFMLPRELGKRLGLDRLYWPRVLRNKWLAVCLLAAFLWSYEALALWDSPWLTAWIIVGYFLSAFVIDTLFTGASFCKWVCPIGQFHFVSAMCSPRSVQVRDEDVCRSCTTHDCINGGPAGRGCGTGLYLPAKRGGMDCTWCMDCVRACPHDNIGLLPRSLGADLMHAGWRGGVGRLLDRPDMIALVALLLAGAFVNAAGMTGPALALQDHLTASWNQPHTLLAATAVVLVGMVIVPALLLPLLGWAGSRAGGRHGALATVRSATGRLTMALFPLGFAMWVVHMLFHLFTSFATAGPVTHRALRDVGLATGTPDWLMGCCLAVPDWVVPVEMLILDAGLIVSVLLILRCARHVAHPGHAVAVAAIWLPLALSLFAAGLWIIFQPMEMRGTLLP